MKPHDPAFWAAAQIRKHLAQGAGSLPGELARSIDRLLNCQRSVQEAWQRLQKAHAHGLHLAARRVQEQLLEQVREVQGEVGQVLVHEGHQEPPVPTLAFLVDELHQLQEELDEVEILPRRNLIVARTEAIELEGLELGPFSIELHLDRLAERRDVSCFDCVALEPNPASSNEDVTHPHVKERGLCAGDATVAIGAALRQGRLFDAFCLVRSVLGEYNSNSPYVSVEDWSGVRCHDCDCLTDRDGLYFCEGCEHDYCSECMSSCDACGRSCCRGCLEEDEVSHQQCCADCRQTCRKCGRTVDRESFVSETELCPECHDEESKKPNKENGHEQSKPTATDKSAATVAA